jgi:flagellar protein FlgJ
MNFTIATADSVPTAPPPAAAAARHPKLTEAAQQFEGMLLQEMLKPMKEHGFCQGDSQDASDNNEGSTGFEDTLSSFGAETMATAIAKGGGLGIAGQVVKQVEGESATSKTASGTKL